MSSLFTSVDGGAPPDISYERLNEEQKRAVTHFGSPLLILSGAGSGKTRVITHKISHLITHHNIAPQHILAVTFTNKAAAEMKARAEALNPLALHATMCTFHSFGARFLRRYGHLEGVAPNFTIYDEDDSLSLLVSLFPEKNKAYLERIMGAIARAKQRALWPDDDLAEVAGMLEGNERLNEYYNRYQERLRAIGNVDFGDLILLPLHILQRHSDVAARAEENISALLIDEYQDTNSVQYKLVRALYHKNMYLCAVGDDDQSIYAFRGSDVTHIVKFPEHFPQTEVIYLLENYRSTQPILSLASHVIAHNRDRYQKELFTRRTGGAKPLLVHLDDDYQEAKYVVSAVADEDSNNEVAIVYRTNAQSRFFESELNRANIPYRIVGGVAFYAREEIRDLLAYLRFIANPYDEIAFARIINKPARGIGAARLKKIFAYAAERGGNLRVTLEGCRHANDATLRAGCAQIAAIIESETEIIANNSADGAEELPSLADLLARIAERSGLGGYYERADREHSTFKCANIAELLASAAYYPATESGLMEFLEQSRLEQEKYQESNEHARVVLITMHNTKGLEFDVVYLVGLQDGLFPRTFELNKEKIEEERRLFYVAITRAKRKLTLTTFNRRHQYGRTIPEAPSRFLSEIDSELIDSLSLYERSSFVGYGGVQQSNRYGEGQPRDGWQSSRRRMDSNGTLDTEDDEARFAVGMAVFNDDYGAGEVMERKKDGSQHILTVRFQSGKVAHFIEKYAALERIAAD